ncbi:zinc-binding dehydrogenase [Nocardiopsis sp. NRRL B-16309]|uniref:zinc-binding dehydrogenase n=1 Tax=Nocardiopsis sp. NRRL B-16309 TaxID=1519494 RepID=UPI0006B04EEF|nr:zinc-binding dehydrogenase [Nocardiopsis sp. NRRL B-16309]KOX16715.1 NADPH:quinone reductase [Nocardiopsis sp. NRRL B-16309]
MRAVVVDEFGGPEVLVAREVPDPVAGPGQVVVDVAAANVMFLDTLVRRGWGTDFFDVAPPYVPGSGVVGRVAAVGAGVEASWVGTTVMADTGTSDPETGLTLAPTGGYAEKAVVGADALIRIPEGVDARAALAVLHDGPTALRLAEAARIERGAWVLVAAATGGAGSLVVQLARAAGARVVGAARGAAKLALARELGALEAVDYSEPGWVAAAVALTGGGAAVVLDGAGGSLGAAAFGAVADGGRFVSYGSSDGEFTEVPEGEAERRGVSVTGLFDLPPLSPADRRAVTSRALDLVAEGTIRPHVGAVVPLERAAEAHAGLEERTVLGKSLLTV